MKNKTKYVCQVCGHATAKWLGRCPDCQEWNTFEEEAIVAVAKNERAVSRLNQTASKPRPISSIKETDYDRTKTKIPEFDRVMGGGIVKGSLVLIGGEPGIGKSTLIMQVCGKLAEQGKEEKVLYFSGEESEGQVGGRARRLNVQNDNLLICHENTWEQMESHLREVNPNYVVIDSIQTTIMGELASAPGTVSQIREVTYRILNYAKAEGITAFVIGHVNKDGNIAGPKVLEHMVDTVVYFEGDQLGQYRILRAIKNRFGNTNEVGIFEMGEKGLESVLNPSQFFLEGSLKNSYGRAITCVVEGSRTLFIEVQALVVENKFGNGRRTTQGVDSNRLSMLVAIVEKYFGIPLTFSDVYVNVVGGIKLVGREGDLAIVAAIISSFKKKAIKDRTVFLGEVGLTGEIRTVPFAQMRLKEIKQMNYHHLAASPKNKFDEMSPLNFLEMSHVTAFEKHLFQ